ncbi:MAG: N-terminal phage integrase SAM-like domain-containing protein [Oscillospiraceae bacterium]
MPKRRANGEGNIRKRKDGRWEGRYTVGHDPETGKAIIKNVLGKTQAEVKEKLKRAIEENVGIDYGRAKTYTVGTWLEVWMENYAKIKLRPSTFKTSQGFLKNHIKPQIGGIPLAELTSLDLQRFYKHLLDGGRVDRVEAKKKPKGLASKTVRNIHQMIGSAYNLAMRAEVGNPQSDTGLRLAKSRAQGDENPDLGSTQRLLPGGQGQRRVRALLPRPRYRIAAWGTAGAKVDGR